jgi:hypothetical protein
VTIGQWLDERTPRPPSELERRITTILGESLSRPASEAPPVLLAAGERMLEELLRNNSTSRASALDLLTADALVTYAFEACSETPSDIDALAARAMLRIGSVA